VIIEPGLIVTGFADAAVGSMSEIPEEGPYGKFNSRVSSLTAGAYEGGLARLGGGPDTVARAIEKALTRRRPRTRYKVTASAKLALAQRRMVSDRMWDRIMTTQFPQPK
jgi:hypothetical protein